VDLDDVDWRLLELLQSDGRMTFSELGRRVSLSAPATTERVRPAGGPRHHHRLWGHC
jgi:Lrp/AsnC family leucine-responsive transcriptional regulator